MQLTALVLAALASSGSAFVVPATTRIGASVTRVAPVHGVQGGNTDYGWGVDVVRKQERAARAAEAGDIVVEVPKPLGAVLEEDKQGNVFIAEVTPGGNADKAGLSKGLELQMVSATFGSDMWNARGAGLDRVMKAIKVRIGTTVTLVVADAKAQSRKDANSRMSAKARAEKEAAAQAKRDALLKEVTDERNAAAKGGFGLFSNIFGRNDLS
eukprot:CAMPEP_0205921714 /NCGR_PEP_ID=MMETSP1325-20131115/13289_1 /ASSEMBLY_ACC=CAM_ASM_000708 /TAXON_ID=236786 /ORGANISM="Florenciella sp., Strain RCC1007" /LENGTH=211 /DNA_ID=CAMNT_0053289601 /DNA_START=34 /DNA_END=669 /DNA_ORIENTATION=+